MVDAIVGNWTLGTITAIQAGSPSTFSGNYSTVTGATSGANLIGITTRELQDSIKIQDTGLNYKLFLDPKLIGANGMANPTYLTPVTTAGQFGVWTILRAPMWWNSDISATKSITIHEGWRVTLQGSALNAFNHPTIGLGTLSMTSTAFGRSTPGGTRRIELRANIEF